MKRISTQEVNDEVFRLERKYKGELPDWKTVAVNELDLSERQVRETSLRESYRASLKLWQKRCNKHGTWYIGSFRVLAEHIVRLRNNEAA